MKLKTLLPLSLVMLASIKVFAYDAEITTDNYVISYNFVGDFATVAKVSEKDQGANESMSVNIPANVTFDDKTYSVTSIGDNAFVMGHLLTSVTISC